jgi:hypothetical protein
MQLTMIKPSKNAKSGTCHILVPSRHCAADLRESYPGPRDLRISEVDVFADQTVPKTAKSLSRIVTGLCDTGAVAKSSCQSASNFDPRSASNFDPLEPRVRVVALAPSELAGVAETGRARVGA